MSQLLQSILSSKLAGASLDDGQDARSDSAHAHAHGNEDWEEVHTSDEELVGIATAPGTMPGTPSEISRPTSPDAGGVGAPPRLRSHLGDPPVKVRPPKAPKSKTDPLRSLPKHLSQRIFLSLPTRDLLSLARVSKRYRRSATLNYCWYRQCLALDPDDPQSSGAPSSAAMANTPSSSSATATAHWTRRESRTDWKMEYVRRLQRAHKDRLRADDLGALSGAGSRSTSGYVTPTRTQRLADSGVKTARDMREEQWEEEDKQAQAGYTKNEMRAFYKEQGGSKGGKAKGVKAKSGKGASRAGTDDLWE